MVRKEEESTITQMDVRRILLALWKWSWLIVLATVVAGGFSYRATSQIPKLYQTTATVQVGQFLHTADASPSDIATAQQLAQSYAPLVRSTSVLQGTISALGISVPPESLATRINAAAVSGTELIRISVVDTSPQRAKAIADELARQLILESPTPRASEQDARQQFVAQQLDGLQKQIKATQEQIGILQRQRDVENSAQAIQEIQAEIDGLQQKVSTWQKSYSDMLKTINGSRTNYLSIAELAYVPSAPISPNMRLNVLLAASVGFLIAFGAAILMECLDDTLRTRDDVSRFLATSTLGLVAKISAPKASGKTGRLVVRDAPDSPVAEQYRLMRSSLQSVAAGKPATILITSPDSRDGRSTTAANLAVSFAQSGKRTVLIDADLRCPSLNVLFGVPKERGLVSVLSNESSADPASWPTEQGDQGTTIDQVGELANRLDTVLSPTIHPLLRLLPSGPTQMRVADLLASDTMGRVLDALGESADVIIVDSPPVLPVVDAVDLAARATAVVLVVQAGRTRGPRARLALDILKRANRPIAGVVLNKAHDSSLARVLRYRRRWSKASSASSLVAKLVPGRAKPAAAEMNTSQAETRRART